MKISKQYLGYYAKYSLFNLKGLKSKVTKNGIFRLKNVSVRVILISFVMLNNTNKTSLRIKMHKIHRGSDFRLHDDYGISLPSVGQRLMFSLFSLAHCGSMWWGGGSLTLDCQ